MIAMPHPLFSPVFWTKKKDKQRSCKKRIFLIMTVVNLQLVPFDGNRWRHFSLSLIVIGPASTKPYRRACFMIAHDTICCDCWNRLFLIGLHTNSLELFGGLITNRNQPFRLFKNAQSAGRKWSWPSKQLYVFFMTQTKTTFTISKI